MKDQMDSQRDQARIQLDAEKLRQKLQLIKLEYKKIMTSQINVLKFSMTK